MPIFKKSALQAGLFLLSVIPAFSITPSGLTLVQKLKGQGASNLVIAPNDSAVFASLIVEQWGIISYRVMPGDTLAPTLLNNSPSLPYANALMAISPSGRFLYTADDILRGPKKLCIFKIGGNASLTPVGSTLPLPTSPSAITLDSAGRFLYVVLNNNLAYGRPGGLATLQVYSVDAVSGNLTQISGSPYSLGSGAISIMLNSRGNVATVSRWPDSKNGLLTTCSLDKSTGAPGTAIDSIQTPKILPSFLVYGLGNILYVGQNPSSMTSKPNAPDLISAYSVDTNGRLSALPASILKVGPSLRHMAASPDGSLLYVLTNNALNAYTMDPQTGVLSNFARRQGRASGLENRNGHFFAYLCVQRRCFAKHLPGRHAPSRPGKHRGRCRLCSLQRDGECRGFGNSKIRFLLQP